MDSINERYFPLLAIQISKEISINHSSQANEGSIRSQEKPLFLFKSKIPVNFVNATGIVVNICLESKIAQIDDSTHILTVQIPFMDKVLIAKGSILDVIGEMTKINGSYSVVAHKINLISDYDEYLYKIYKTFETQFYYLKEKVFPQQAISKEDIVVEDDMSDTSAEEIEDELDCCKHEVFHYLLFNINPDQKLFKSQLLTNHEYVDFAMNEILKAKIDKDPKELVKECIEDLESKGFLTFHDHIIKREKLCAEKVKLRDFVLEFMRKYYRHIPISSIIAAVQQEFGKETYSESSITKVVDELLQRSLAFESYPNMFSLIL